MRQSLLMAAAPSHFRLRGRGWDSSPSDSLTTRKLLNLLVVQMVGMGRLPTSGYAAGTRLNRFRSSAFRRNVVPAKQGG